MLAIADDLVTRQGSLAISAGGAPMAMAARAPSVRAAELRQQAGQYGIRLLRRRGAIERLVRPIEAAALVATCRDNLLQDKPEVGELVAAREGGDDGRRVDQAIAVHAEVVGQV